MTCSKNAQNLYSNNGNPISNLCSNLQRLLFYEIPSRDLECCLVCLMYVGFGYFLPFFILEFFGFCSFWNLLCSRNILCPLCCLICTFRLKFLCLLSFVNFCLLIFFLVINFNYFLYLFFIFIKYFITYQLLKQIDIDYHFLNLLF